MLRSRRRPSSTSDWIGWRVDDAHGRRVGTFAGMYEDEITGAPAWYLVRLGRFSTRYVLVPPADVLSWRTRVRLPYLRDTIEASTLFYTPPSATDPAIEHELRRHYRLGDGGDREVGVVARRRAGAGEI